MTGPHQLLVYCAHSPAPPTPAPPTSLLSTLTIPAPHPPAPAKPTTFTVTAISSTELQLNWTVGDCWRATEVCTIRDSPLPLSVSSLHPPPSPPLITIFFIPLPLSQSPANDPRVSPILSWVVQYRTGNTPTASRPISDPAARQHTLMGLMKGTVYSVSLAGVNSAGQGNFTDEMPVRTLFDSEWSTMSLQAVPACMMACSAVWLLEVM